MTEHTALRIKALEQALQTVLHDLRVPEKLRRMRINGLEQALQTVIHDRRIDEKLGSASAVCQQEQRDVAALRSVLYAASKRSQPTCRKRFAPNSLGLAKATAQKTSQMNTVRMICERISIEREIRISLWHNDESDDWSIKINGEHHDQLTSEIMEALVECALIVAQTSLTRAFAQRPQ
jgi:hypothetical protein